MIRSQLRAPSHPLRLFVSQRNCLIGMLSFSFNGVKAIPNSRARSLGPVNAGCFNRLSRLRTQRTIWVWLSDKSQPNAKSLRKLRRFLDNEAKRPAQGDGIRPVEPVPYKITRPLQQARYARICPFCRKARGKIRKLGAALFQGACLKCGATGPTREIHQEALRAWNGRE